MMAKNLCRCWCFTCKAYTQPNDDRSCPTCGQADPYTDRRIDPEVSRRAYAMGYGHTPSRYQGD